ncbi:MAG TPA: cytochrome c oxidase subunit II [Pyrinomonadaceae bacterium]|nr:cytochrome c oxidase subunit II [Pyrinomonadaceae bacterium]HMP65083.1 cytochrome c oxidase subunit II [Pyrinomonadaceae bacterium]
MQTNSWIPLFPEAASSFAWQVDYLYFYLILVSVGFMIPIVAAIFFFVVKYREKEKYATPEEMHGSIVLETVWSIIPFVISMTIFLGGAVVYYTQYRMPDDAMNVYVVGKQWMWKIQHETGQREINELHVPVNTRVKLTMTTEDVLHDFSIPAFRTKADVVPGRFTYLWFEATKPGAYHLFCAEYCGLNHSGMIGTVYVMEQPDFEAWLQGNVSGQTPVEQGRDLFENKLGCASCHAAGQGQRGAVLEGIYGKEVSLVGGQKTIRNDEYIRNSILNPGSQVVEGYQPIMPSFKGQVTEEQILALVAYIKSLSGVDPNAPAMTAPAPAPANAANSNDQGGN